MTRKTMALQDPAQLDEVSPIQAEEITRICGRVCESCPCTIRFFTEVCIEIVPA